jgi:phage I-like protein
MPPTTAALDHELPEDDDAPSSKPLRKKPKKKQTRIRIGADGSVDVHHMKSIDLPAIALSANAAGPGDGPTWNQINKLGEFKGHAAGHFAITAKTNDEIVRNFEATQNQHVPIDFEHASEMNATDGTIPTHGAPAQGWIKKLHNRGAEGLWGLFDWHELARGYVRSGQYKFLSPAIRFRSRDRVTGDVIGARLTSVALTNNPFLDGLQPLVASDRHGPEDDEEDEPAPLAARDSDDHGAEGASDMDAVKMKEIEDKSAAIAAKNDELSLSLSAEKARANKNELEVKALLDWKAKREEDDLRTLVDEAFETYKDSKGLEDKNKDSMLRLARADVGAFGDLYPRLPPARRHLLTNLTGGRTSVAAPTARVETASEMAARLMKDQPELSREEALLTAGDALWRRAHGR